MKTVLNRQSYYLFTRTSGPAGQSRRPKAGFYSRPTVLARPDFSGESEVWYGYGVWWDGKGPPSD